MSDIFTSYQQQFIRNLSNTSKKVHFISVQSNQKKEMAFAQLKQDIEQCEKDIKRMEAEVNTFDVQIKFEYSRKVRQYKKDLQDLNKKLLKAQDQFAYEKNKQMLIGAQLDEQNHSRKYHKQNLIKHGEMLSDTTYKVKDSVRIMRETEEISNNVAVQLVRQTDQMKGQKQKLLEMNDDLSKSERFIQSIMMRIRKNKFVLSLVVVIVLIIGIIILAIHFSNSSSNSNSNSNSNSTSN